MQREEQIVDRDSVQEMAEEAADETMTVADVETAETVPFAESSDEEDAEDEQLEGEPSALASEDEER